MTVDLATLEQLEFITGIMADGATALALVLLCYMLYYVWKDWPRD